MPLIERVCHGFMQRQGYNFDLLILIFMSKFRAEDFSVEDAAWLSRPVEVDSNQIEALIENNQHYSTWKIADILKISKSIKLLGK